MPPGLVCQSKEALRKAGAWGLDAIFPRRCGACTAFDTGGICAACRATLQYIEPPFCERCGLKFPGAPAAGCPDCRAISSLRAPAFDCVRSVAAYTGAMRPAIHRFKYGGAVSLAGPLAALCFDYLENSAASPLNTGIPLASVDFIVPVPLHKLRRWRRGYNQSELLAEELAGLCAARYPRIASAGLLARPRYTVPQIELDRDRRKRNMHGAFEMNEQCPSRRAAAGSTVLLIDDVCTTTATLAECARVLREAGVARVFGLTVARQL